MNKMRRFYNNKIIKARLTKFSEIWCTSEVLENSFDIIKGFQHHANTNPSRRPPNILEWVGG